MKALAMPAVALLAMLATLEPAYAAHQTVLGSKLTLKDPKPSVDAAKRQWRVKGKGSAGAGTIVGDPVTSGATISVFTDGSVAGGQSYALPQGVGRKGKPLWRATATGFAYSDPDGVNGPVKSVKISRSGQGSLQLQASANARHGSIDVVPANLGTRGCVRLDLGGGDSYHVLFDAGSTIGRNDAKQFQSSSATTEGLCCSLGSSPPCCPTSCPAPDACHDAGSCDPLVGACENPARPDGSTCDAGLSNRYPMTCSAGVCGSCVPAGTCSSAPDETCAFDAQCDSGGPCVVVSSPSPRYVDNGDGTITDRQTCLVWEKKDAFDGTPVACPGGAGCSDPHDADNTYTWGDSSWLANGTAFTDFVAGLNASSFAGHADWRLPGGELATLVDPSAPGCGSGGACIDPAFDAGCTPTCSGTDPACSCTRPFRYWLSSSASFVDFEGGSTGSGTSTDGLAVRAVRGCTASLVIPPSVKSQCVGDCSLQCGVVGSCIFGCELGQVNSVDQCYVECGPDDVCLQACLQTVDCIVRGSQGVCAP